MNRNPGTIFATRFPVLTVVFALVTAAYLGVAAPAHAGIINYSVSINTNDLAGAGGAGEFASEFLLEDGDGGIGNSIIASNFNFDGGSAETPDDSFGTASGNYSSGIQVTDDSLFSVYSQQFTPGSTLNFNLQVNIQNADLANYDLFSFSFLQNYSPPGGVSDYIPTDAPNGTTLFNIQFDDLLNPTINTFSGTGSFSNVTATVTEVSPAPEPGTWAMMAMGLAGMIFFAWRRKRDAARGLAVAAPSQSCA